MAGRGDDAAATPAIRPAVAGDADAIAALVAAAYGHYVARIGKPPGPMLDDYRRVVRDHRVQVAVEGQRIVGVVMLVETRDGILLDNVAVCPRRQGRGIGAALIAAGEAIARAAGYRNLDLYTHESMVENIARYARRGYREVARREEQGYRRVYMRKPLSGSWNATGR